MGAVALTAPRSHVGLQFSGTSCHLRQGVRHGVPLVGGFEENPLEHILRWVLFAPYGIRDHYWMIPMTSTSRLSVANRDAW